MNKRSLLIAILIVSLLIFGSLAVGAQDSLSPEGLYTLGTVKLEFRAVEPDKGLELEGWTTMMAPDGKSYLVEDTALFGNDHIIGVLVEKSKNQEDLYNAAIYFKAEIWSVLYKNTQPGTKLALVKDGKIFRVYNVEEPIRDSAQVLYRVQKSELERLLAGLAKDTSLTVAEHKQKLNDYITEAKSGSENRYDLQDSINLKMKEKQYDEALELCEKACQIFPDEVGFLYSMGNCYFMSGRYEEAVPVFQRSLELDPENELIIRFMLSQVYFCMCEYAEAKNNCEIALALAKVYTGQDAELLVQTVEMYLEQINASLKQ